MSDPQEDSSVARFRELFAEKYGPVVRFCERRISDREVARELADECFAIAWEKRAAVGPVDLPWLYATARFLIANQYRKRDRARAAESLAAHSSSDGPAEDRVDARVDVRTALLSLPEADREVLYLLYWDGLTAHEAAHVMNLREGTIRARAKRARDKLAAILDAPRASSRSREEVIRELG